MLVGREVECSRLDLLLAAAGRGDSAVLVIRGEPGVGKSALLRYAIGQAAEGGMTTVVARGVESEAELPFAALADVVRPIRHLLAAIPPSQAQALNGALALGPAVPGDRFAACAATLSLLAAAAEAGPVVAVVDDIQWLDASSAEALLFAARRLGCEGVTMLLALREGEGTALDLEGLPTLEVTGLDEQASVRLLTGSQPAIAPGVAARLHAAVRGNPLALMEVPALLSEAERSGLMPLPEPLPAGPLLEQAFLRRLRTLPRPAQRAVLVVAANESGDVPTIQRALEQMEIPVGYLEAAESAGLIATDGAQLRFRHPLIRSAVYQAADPVTRREVHRALATALDAEQVADRRAWHLAAATTAPDESIAAALEQAAGRSQARSGYGTAARALARAAALSPGASERARRLLAAAGAYQLAGRPAEGLRLLDEVAAAQPPEEMRAKVEHLRADIEIWMGNPLTGHQRMLAEAARAAPHDLITAALLLAEAALPCFMAGEVVGALDTARKARAAADAAGGPAPLLVDVILAEAMVLAGLAGEASALVDDCLRRALIAGPDAASAAQYLPFSLVCLERYVDARGLIAAGVSAARQASAVGLLPYGLALQSDVEFRTGNLAVAYAIGTESIRLAHETAQYSSSAFCLATLARVEAAQGRDDDCRAHGGAALDLARQHGLGSILNYANAALGLLELGRGRPQQALIYLEESARITRDKRLGETNVVQWQPDYIESLAHGDRTGEALEALEVFERDADRTNRLWAQATAARCRGYLAQGDSAQYFERALELHQASSAPSAFEIARTQLCYGETLRRQRQRIEARQLLNDALEVFERLGAEPWANRARVELSATGEKARKRDVARTRELTPQELQISLAVAQGATNREAAAQHFLSPRTVEAHLSSAYRKLGIRSRTELVRHFSGDTEARKATPLPV